MTISVIIPTYKRVEQVKCLIRSLQEQNFPRENLQILLISNLKETDLREKSREWVKEFYDFKYMETGEKGVNKARNLGIRFAGGDILYFLDDDCLLPSSDHLMRLITRHQELKGIAGIGGGYQTTHVLKGASQFYHEQQTQWVKIVSQNLNRTSQLIGGNASYKREVFDKGFAFDSQIIFGGSEESLNRLLTDNGYHLKLFRDLDVYHRVHVNILSLMRKSFQQGVGYFENQLKNGVKNHGIDMRKEAAFNPASAPSRSHFIYNLFFKLGYFWAGSAEKTRGFVIFRVFFFLILLLKSRWVIIKNHILLGFFWKYITRFSGGVWYYIGKAWYYIGALYGMAVRFYHHTFLAKLWYFGKYQFFKRIWPLLSGNKKNRN